MRLNVRVAIELPELVVPDQAAWRSWLIEHHATSPGAWLVLAKKGTTTPTMLRYDQALDEALCFGWIDGQVRRRDEATTFQRWTRRGPRSMWSARNVGHVGRLTDAGLMHPAGLAEVARAQGDGRWDRAYAGPATAVVPTDLASAIAADPLAQATFDTLSSQNRYALIFRLGQLRTPAGRAKRIAAYVEMLARGETIHPQ